MGFLRVRNMRVRAYLCLTYLMPRGFLQQSLKGERPGLEGTSQLKPETADHPHFGFFFVLFIDY